MAFPIVPLVLAGVQLASALSQKNKRPERGVSGATNESVNTARTDANLTRRPGRDLANEQIRQEGANALANVQRSTNDVNKILASASAIQGSQNRAMQQQDMMDIQAREAAKGRLHGALGQQAQEQQRAWDFNYGLPYQQAEMRKQQNLGAGIQNASTAYNDFYNYRRWLEMFGEDKKSQS